MDWELVCRSSKRHRRMFHVVLTWVRAFRRSSVLLVSLLSVLALAAVFYAYVLYQWNAAQLAVKDHRLDEARACLKICLAVWPRSATVHLLAARAARLNGDFGVAEEHLDRCLLCDASLKEDVDLEYLLLRVQKGDVDFVGPRLLVYV